MSEQHRAWRIIHAIQELKYALNDVGIDAPVEMVLSGNRDGWYLQRIMEDARILTANTDLVPEGTHLLAEMDGIKLRWPIAKSEGTNALVNDPKDYVSDGSTANYYELPEHARELQDLISHRDMNAQDGEIFRAVYRKGLAKHSDALRDAKKVKFYADAEVERLEKLAKGETE